MSQAETEPTPIEIIPPPDPPDYDLFVFLMMVELHAIIRLCDLIERERAGA
jgi:hypothetical protein